MNHFLCLPATRICIALAAALTANLALAAGPSHGPRAAHKYEASSAATTAASARQDRELCASIHNVGPRDTIRRASCVRAEQLAQRVASGE